MQQLTRTALQERIIKLAVADLLNKNENAVLKSKMQKAYAKKLYGLNKYRDCFLQHH